MSTLGWWQFLSSCKHTFPTGPEELAAGHILLYSVGKKREMTVLDVETQQLFWSMALEINPVV